MAGERVPDTSPPGKGGSTDDDISLREHMQRQIDTQRYYFERVITDLRDLLDQRFAAQQSAVDELKATTAERFANVNEFRAQLNDQASRFISRDESLSLHERTALQIADIKERLNLNQGRSTGLDKAWALLVGVIVAVGSVIAIVLGVR